MTQQLTDPPPVRLPIVNNHRRLTERWMRWFANHFERFQKRQYTTATLNSPWANVGSGRASAGYVLDALGFVHLQGYITSGTSGSVAFTVPHSPSYTHLQPGQTDVTGTVGWISVGTTGDVSVHLNGATNIDLSSVHYPTFG